MVGLVETKARLRTGSGTTVESAYKPLALMGYLTVDLAPVKTGFVRRSTLASLAFSAGEGPSGKLESVLSRKTETLKGGELSGGRSARTPALLGTQGNARSQVELGMWRGRARRGRAGQAFKLGGPDVADGTTANFIRRGLSRAATGWPGCQKTKLLKRSCLRFWTRAWGHREFADE